MLTAAGSLVTILEVKNLVGDIVGNSEWRYLNSDVYEFITDDFALLSARASKGFVMIQMEQYVIISYIILINTTFDCECYICVYAY